MAFIPSTSYYTITASHVFYNNIQYGFTNKQTMDVWIPTGAGPYAIVIHFHGGGFIVGDKAGISEATVNSFLDEGVAFATVNYPLVKTIKDPEGIIKCFDSGLRAIKFLRYYLNFFNIDTDKFFIRGSSAGCGIAQHIAYGDWPAGIQDKIDHTKGNIQFMIIDGPQAGYWYPDWADFIEVEGLNIKHIYDTIEYEQTSVNRTLGIEEWSDLSTAPLINDKNNYHDFLTRITNGFTVPTHIESNNTLYTELNPDGTVTDITHSPYHGKAIRDALITEGQEARAFLNGIEDTTLGEDEIGFLNRHNI